MFHDETKKMRLWVLIDWVIGSIMVRDHNLSILKKKIRKQIKGDFEPKKNRRRNIPWLEMIKKGLFLPLKREETRKRELNETIRYSGMPLQMILSKRVFILFLNFFFDVF